ncbi:MAG: hypothetical protein JW724_02790 [Candidatus Altiarchaeota archaeon]|nr:hypothetical protein [Candidatus Altiarchaeota archaeon]
MDLKIVGVYRDRLYSDDGIAVDFGWRSNAIVADFGRFLAALMKRDFEKKVGIEYMAFGGGNGSDAKFKDCVKSFFDSKRELPYMADDGRWAWAKKIDDSKMEYLINDDQVENDGVTNEVTNRLRIEVEIDKAKPVTETLIYEEFALLGIDESGDGPDTSKMFFVDYVKHAPITKDASMKLTRTIVLTFPLGEGEVP